MKLYLISRTDTVNYDEYDSFVVAAESIESALEFHPRGKNYLSEQDIRDRYYAGWTSKDNLMINDIGIAHDNEEKVIIASFNAG